MKPHASAIGVSLLIGIFGCVVFLLVGSVTKRGEYGFIAGCLFFFMLAFLLVKKYPPSWWYTGLVLNLPIWCLFIFWAEAGQFKLYLWGLIASIAFAFMGVLAGMLFPKKIINT